MILYFMVKDISCVVAFLNVSFLTKFSHQPMQLSLHITRQCECGRAKTSHTSSEAFDAMDVFLRPQWLQASALLRVVCSSDKGTIHCNLWVKFATEVSNICWSMTLRALKEIIVPTWTDSQKWCWYFFGFYPCILL